MFEFSPADGARLAIACALAGRGTVDLGFARLFLVDDRLRKLAHEATADVFVDHGARSERMGEVAIGRVMMPVTMTMTMVVIMAMIVCV